MNNMVVITTILMEATMMEILQPIMVDAMEAITKDNMEPTMTDNLVNTTLRWQSLNLFN